MPDQPPPRISRDPTGDIAPNYDTPAFDSILSNLSGTREVAIQQLLAAWQVQHDADVAAWDTQTAADNERLRAENEARAEVESAARLAQEKEAEADRLAAEKKKPTPPTIAEGVAPPRDSQVRYSAYVRDKMREYKFVDLYHFHPDITSKVHASARDSDRTFSITEREDGQVSLVPAGRSNHGGRIVKDADLTFDEITLCKINYISCMEDLRWPEPIIRTHANFHIALDAHPLRTVLPHGPRVLARYHSVMREAWYFEYALNKSVPWDISIINRERMNDIQIELMNEHGWKLAERARARSRSPERSSSRQGRFRGERQDRGSREDRAGDSRADDRRGRGSGPANQSFPRGAHSSSVRGACVICLGRFQHVVQRCRAQYFHQSSTPTRCSRENGDIVEKLTKRFVCLHFNLDNGCGGAKSGAQHPVHECSACGSTSHGAQECHLGKTA